MWMSLDKSPEDFRSTNWSGMFLSLDSQDAADGLCKNFLPTVVYPHQSMNTNPGKTRKVFPLQMKHLKAQKIFSKAGDFQLMIPANHWLRLYWGSKSRKCQLSDLTRYARLLILLKLFSSQSPRPCRISYYQPFCAYILLQTLRHQPIHISAAFWNPPMMTLAGLSSISFDVSGIRQWENVPTHPACRDLMTSRQSYFAPLIKIFLCSLICSHCSCLALLFRPSGRPQLLLHTTEGFFEGLRELPLY